MRVLLRTSFTVVRPLTALIRSLFSQHCFRAWRRGGAQKRGSITPIVPLHITGNHTGNTGITKKSSTVSKEKYRRDTFSCLFRTLTPKVDVRSSSRFLRFASEIEENFHLFVFLSIFNWMHSTKILGLSKNYCSIIMNENFKPKKLHVYRSLRLISIYIDL